jgi:hypothetical protein
LGSVIAMQLADDRRHFAETHRKALLIKEKLLQSSVPTS